VGVPLCSDGGTPKRRGLAFPSEVATQQIRHDYLPLLREFLERCVICAVTGDAAAHHATHTCRQLRAVLDFWLDQHSEALELYTRLQFLERTTCWHCMSPWWVCGDYKVCPQHSAASKRLVTTSLTVAWEMRTTNDTCRLALEESGAPMDATASEIRVWFDQHADPSAGEYNYVSNAAVVLLNLWSALLTLEAATSCHHRLAKCARRNS
jgi:hypothetical protein